MGSECSVAAAEQHRGEEPASAIAVHGDHNIHMGEVLRQGW
jgi:hypothetical protein